MAGGVADREAYARYLRGMSALVAALAPAPAERSAHALWATWFDRRRLALLAQDLQRLGAAPVAPPLPALPASWWMGGNYVLEGSALGARLLLRDVARLRQAAPDTPLAFLEHHAQRSQRWPGFLAALAELRGSLREDAGRGARHAFGLVADAINLKEHA